jgi:hypothetical protein
VRGIQAYPVVERRHTGNAASGYGSQCGWREGLRMALKMTPQAIEIALVKQSLSDFKERYERDQSEFKEKYENDQIKADSHRAEMLRRLSEIRDKENQQIGMVKMAKFGYAVLALLVAGLMSIGLPKIASWVISLTR